MNCLNVPGHLWIKHGVTFHTIKFFQSLPLVCYGSHPCFGSPSLQLSEWFPHPKTCLSLLRLKTTMESILYELLNRCNGNVKKRKILLLASAGSLRDAEHRCRLETTFATPIVPVFQKCHWLSKVLVGIVSVYVVYAPKFLLSEALHSLLQISFLSKAHSRLHTFSPELRRVPQFQ